MSKNSYLMQLYEINIFKSWSLSFIMLKISMRWWKIAIKSEKTESIIVSARIILLQTVEKNRELSYVYFGKNYGYVYSLRLIKLCGNSFSWWRIFFAWNSWKLGGVFFTFRFPEWFKLKGEINGVKRWVRPSLSG